MAETIRKDRAFAWGLAGYRARTCTGSNDPLLHGAADVIDRQQDLSRDPKAHQDIAAAATLDLSAT